MFNCTEWDYFLNNCLCESGRSKSCFITQSHLTIKFRGLGFLLFSILLGVFLANSSLGAGSDERTQTPLGAFDWTDLHFLYCTENSHEYIFIKSFDHHFFSSLLSLFYWMTNRKWRSVTSYSKTKKSLYVDIASRADSGPGLCVLPIFTLRNILPMQGPNRNNIGNP
jgi:hypothetical protein